MLGEMVNFHKVNSLKHQPRDFGHFMLRLTFWRLTISPNVIHFRWNIFSSFGLGTFYAMPNFNICCQSNCACFTRNCVKLETLFGNLVSLIQWEPKFWWWRCYRILQTLRKRRPRFHRTASRKGRWRAQPLKKRPKISLWPGINSFKLFSFVTDN